MPCLPKTHCASFKTVNAMVTVSYTHLMFTGVVTRPLIDKFKVSREKLAYICDATSAPVNAIIPLNSCLLYTSTRTRSSPSSLCPAPSRTVRGRCPISPAASAASPTGMITGPPLTRRIRRPTAAVFRSWTAPSVPVPKPEEETAPLPPEPTLDAEPLSPLPDGGVIGEPPAKPEEEYAKRAADAALFVLSVQV